MGFRNPLTRRIAAALSAAEAAWTTANGKNAVRWATTAPAGDGTAPGDVWWRHAGGTVTGQWEWDGATWQQRALGSDVIAGLDVGKLTAGVLAVGQSITAGDPAASHVVLDGNGLRKYAANGTDVEVDLSASGATFSGTITGSAVIGGDIYTNLTGPRVHLHDGMDPTALARVLATLGIGPLNPGDTAAGTDISLHSGLTATDPGSLAIFNAVEASDLYRLGVLSLTSPTSPPDDPAQLALYELHGDSGGGVMQRRSVARLVADLVDVEGPQQVKLTSAGSVLIYAASAHLPWRQTNPHGSTLVVIIVADVAARTAALAAVTAAYAPNPIPNPVVVWRKNAPAGQQLEAWNGATWETIGGQPAASTTVAGIVELATTAETITGTDATRAVTPAGLAARTATEARAGIVELATTAEASAGTDTTRAVTPAGVKAAITAAVPRQVVDGITTVPSASTTVLATPVTFAAAFASPPTIVPSSIITGASITIWAYPINVTTTGFTLRTIANGTVATPFTVPWQASGVLA